MIHNLPRSTVSSTMPPSAYFIVSFARTPTIAAPCSSATFTSSVMTVRRMNGLAASWTRTMPPLPCAFIHAATLSCRSPPPSTIATTFVIANCSSIDSICIRSSGFTARMTPSHAGSSSNTSSVWIRIGLSSNFKKSLL